MYYTNSISRQSELSRGEVLALQTNMRTSTDYDSLAPSYGVTVRRSRSRFEAPAEGDRIKLLVLVEIS